MNDILKDNDDEIAHLTMKSTANTESVERTVGQEYNIHERYPTSAIANVYWRISCFIL